MDTPVTPYTAGSLPEPLRELVPQGAENITIKIRTNDGELHEAASVEFDWDIAAVIVTAR
jgi:hypothetical protein